ncbi:MAG: type 2 isopentenyl-diphosphate Delta-isomerase [Candidatus Aenigmatarchaeota archaeon]
MDIKQRKDDHIRICMEEDVEYSHNFWGDICLKHCALPEFDLSEVSTKTGFLGKRLASPILIGAISGGIEKAGGLNSLLARTAEKYGIGLCVGSQRPLLKLKGDREALKSYEVIKGYDIPLKVGNIGAPQLPSLSNSDIDLLFDSIGADFLAVHLNYPQEVVQPEGDTNARGVLEKIKEISASYPVIVKEVGFGISGEVAAKLKDAGVKAIDVAGVSGTNWIKVEYYRSKSAKSFRKVKIAKTFKKWGIPAPLCLLECGEAGLPLIGSSGIENGHDAAKVVALGAGAVSIARPILRYAMKGEAELGEKLERTIEELKIAMFLTGSKNLEALKTAKYWTRGKLKDFL